jgi:hypothetical protein
LLSCYITQERDEGQELRDKLDAIDARAAVAGADQEAALKEYRAILEYEPTGPEGAASESLQRVKEDSIYRYSVLIHYHCRNQHSSVH